MKYYLQFIYFVVLGFQIPTCSYSQVAESKVLLLDYSEEVCNLQILKDYQDKTKQYRYSTVQPIENPIFNGQRLYIDEPFDVNDTSTVIFLGEGRARYISLPFKHSKVVIEGLVNDSTVKGELNNVWFLSKPGETVVDSLSTIIQEGERLIQITTVFRLNNYGLISKSNIYDSEDKEFETKQMLDQKYENE